MRLAYLPANAAWVFLFGDRPVRMGNGPLFHRTRADAVHEAAIHGLIVLQDNAMGVAT